MAPNLGRGACQSLEDAVVLSRLTAGAGTDEIPPVLASYTAVRLPRTTDVVRWSHRAARMTTWTSRPAVTAQNTAAGLLGKLAPSAALRGIGPIYDWQPKVANDLCRLGRVPAVVRVRRWHTRAGRMAPSAGSS
jgi:2-polyprenyl-6-methoxyphenol hydroxylase-like FAD-dependent oxidoreductase